MWVCYTWYKRCVHDSMNVLHMLQEICTWFYECVTHVTRDVTRDMYMIPWMWYTCYKRSVHDSVSVLHILQEMCACLCACVLQWLWVTACNILVSEYCYSLIYRKNKLYSFSWTLLIQWVQNIPVLAYIFIWCHSYIHV